jgi:hypothetical protein
MRRAPLAALLLLATGPAWADSHGVTVQNGTPDTIRAIIISPAPGSTDNRLRSSLPPGATGRIVYSTGCQANVRIGYDNGRTEDHPAVDVCSDPRIIAGTAGIAGPALSAASTPAKPAVNATTLKTASTQPVKVPPPVVPPWTGKSITKRFGGMD